MTISKDLAKKMYQSKLNYTDAMYQQISNKAVWNIVLEKYPRLAEFFLTGQGKRDLTVLERSLLEFITQSEFIKPYTDSNYPEREYRYWPKAGTTVEPPETPVPPNEPGPEEPPEVPPWEAICDAWHDGCWCSNGSEQPIEIWATYPITSITQTWGHSYLIIDEGQGTSHLKGRVYGNEADRGFVTWEICMDHGHGECCSNINVFECPEEECCPPDTPTLICAPRNPETVGASSEETLYVIGGTGPFKLEISGDGTWENGTTDPIEKTYSRAAKIVTDASCGTVAVTWTDACGQSVTCTLRILGGCWCGTACDTGWIEGNCNCGMDDDGVCVAGGDTCTRTKDECQQEDDTGIDWQTSGFCNVAYCDVCDGSLCGSECIPPTRGFNPLSWTFVYCSGYECSGCYCDVQDTCSNPETYPPPDNLNARICYARSAGYPRYREWKCVDICEP